MALVLYTELKYERIQCFGVSILRFLDKINPDNYPRFLPYPKAEKEITNPLENLDWAEKVEIKFDLDVEYLKGLDPRAWKDQDHYAVLGLREAR